MDKLLMKLIFRHCGGLVEVVVQSSQLFDDGAEVRAAMT